MSQNEEGKNPFIKKEEDQKNKGRKKSSKKKEKKRELAKFRRSRMKGQNSKVMRQVMNILTIWPNGLN